MYIVVYSICEFDEENNVYVRNNCSMTIVFSLFDSGLFLNELLKNIFAEAE